MSRRKDRSAFRRLFEELAQDEGLREQDDEIAVEDEEVDEMYEISVTAIRRELRRMRRLREQEEGRAAEADPALAHGGEDLGDIELDISEEDLINALADELGEPSVPTPTVESRRRARRRRNRKVNETRARRAVRNNRTTGAARENVRLKKQLQEMNLFNAKLLFANKLMQNRGLSTKQQRAIVEALDKASTIKEAKLLYSTLSKSLQRRSGRTLSEGSSRLLSSSSRSTRSAAPAKSGVEVDRWAVLAGLHNK